MTYEERQEYERLPYSDQTEYDHIKNKHPNWSHQQIMGKVAFSHKIDDITENGDRNINPNDPNILIEILEGAKEFLKGVGIFIEAVFDMIDDALTTLGGWISDGLEYVGNKLEEFWDWLWS